MSDNHTLSRTQSVHLMQLMLGLEMADPNPQALALFQDGLRKMSQMATVLNELRTRTVVSSREMCDTLTGIALRNNQLTPEQGRELREEVDADDEKAMRQLLFAIGLNPHSADSAEFKLFIDHLRGYVQTVIDGLVIFGFITKGTNKPANAFNTIMTEMLAEMIRHNDPDFML